MYKRVWGVSLFLSFRWSNDTLNIKPNSTLISLKFYDIRSNCNLSPSTSNDEFIEDHIWELPTIPSEAIIKPSMTPWLSTFRKPRYHPVALAGRAYNCRLRLCTGSAPLPSIGWSHLTSEQFASAPCTRHRTHHTHHTAKRVSRLSTANSTGPLCGKLCTLCVRVQSFVCYPGDASLLSSQRQINRDKQTSHLSGYDAKIFEWAFVRKKNGWTGTCGGTSLFSSLSALLEQRAQKSCSMFLSFCYFFLRSILRSQCPVAFWTLLCV